MNCKLIRTIQTTRGELTVYLSQILSPSRKFIAIRWDGQVANASTPEKACINCLRQPTFKPKSIRRI